MGTAAGVVLFELSCHEKRRMARGSAFDKFDKPLWPTRFFPARFLRSTRWRFQSLGGVDHRVGPEFQRQRSLDIQLDGEWHVTYFPPVRLAIDCHFRLSVTGTCRLQVTGPEAVNDKTPVYSPAGIRVLVVDDNRDSADSLASETEVLWGESAKTPGLAW